MVFRPQRLAERLIEGGYQREFCPPLSFLTLGILCGFALMHDVWTISAGSLSRLGESPAGWVGWITQSLVDEFSSLSLSTIVMRTLPTVIVVVLVGWLAGRCVVGTTRETKRAADALAAAICLVIGFKLFLRLAQGLWHLANVRLSAIGGDLFGPGFDGFMGAITWAYLGMMVYVLLFAGTIFLAAVVRRVARPLLRPSPLAVALAWGLATGLFLGTFIVPSAVWNIWRLERIVADDHLLKVLPLTSARLEFQDQGHAYVSANLLVRNEADKQVLMALPREIPLGSDHSPLECQYESEAILDGTLMLDPAMARVVRVTWRVDQAGWRDLAEAGSVPLIVQLGSVDDVLAEQVQTCSLQVALDPTAIRNTPGWAERIAAEGAGSESVVR
jgi:hypothetical protein